MFRQFTALLLLLAFMVSSFSKAVIVVDFYANQDAIAKTLCVNRGNPNMHCCGRCQLRKRLAKDANQEQNNPERRPENKDVLFLSERMLVLPLPFRYELTLPYGAFSSRNLVDRAAAIDHPPA
jgi:hypothetical protein